MRDQSPQTAQAGGRRNQHEPGAVSGPVEVWALNDLDVSPPADPVVELVDKEFTDALSTVARTR